MKPIEPSENVLPAIGRLAGIDFGTVRIGIAVSDHDQIIASPLETYQCRSPEHDSAFFKQLVIRESLLWICPGIAGSYEW